MNHVSFNNNWIVKCIHWCNSDTDVMGTTKLSLKNRFKACFMNWSPQLTLLMR